ncbi:MAG: DsbA family protein [Rhodospirillales bacterium]|nr:DsbA family protein [Rhodospirillales bacterium]
MKRSAPVFAVVLGLAFLTGGACAHAADKSLTEKDVQRIVETYLREHPETILESVEAHQKKKYEEEVQKQKDNLQSYKDFLHDADAPSAGNPKGDVTVIEFFDYNCGYCKRAFPDIVRLIETDPNVRVVLRDIPILGDTSVLAAKWALAAHLQGKYFDFHKALMEHNGPIDEATLERLGKSAGLDTEKLRKDAGSEDVQKRLDKDMEVSRAIGITGTPAFIVNDDIARGAVGFDGLKQAVEEARKAKKK